MRERELLVEYLEILLRGVQCFSSLERILNFTKCVMFVRVISMKLSITFC